MKVDKKNKDSRKPESVKKPVTKSQASVENERTPRTRRGLTLKEGEALQKLLSYLLSLLMEEDKNKWFSIPIDDSMAPGYSDVIKEKMDFSKMEDKLDSQTYKSMAQFKYDFLLIVENCMKFNKPETVYHKAAKKLESFGLQLLSKKSLREIVLDRPIYSSISTTEIGFDIFDLADIDETEVTERKIGAEEKLKKKPADSVTPRSQKKVKKQSVESTPGVLGTEIEDLFISAAERVKRRRGQQHESASSDTETPRRKKSNVSSRKSSIDDSSSQPPHDQVGKSNQSGEETGSTKMKTVDKIRSLHQEKSEGTYVMCEVCKKWRFLTEYEDPF